MARFTLRLGAPIVVPISAPRKISRYSASWPARASREAAALSAGVERLSWALFQRRYLRVRHAAQAALARQA